MESFMSKVSSPIEVYVPTRSAIHLGKADIYEGGAETPQRESLGEEGH